VTDEPIDPRAGERLARAARAAQTLSETLWEALNEELGAAPRRDRVAELSKRLSDVSKTIASLTLTGAAVAPGPEERGVESGPPRTREHPFSESSAQVPSTPAPPAPAMRGEAVLVDERASSSSGPRASNVSSAVAPIEPSPAPVAPPESSLPRAPAESGQASSSRDAEQAAPEIEIKDERREHTHREGGQAPGRNQSQWIASIERRLERYERDRLPFAVMLVELVDVERLRHAELPGEMARMTGSVETALSGELRPADSLMRESPGRYWLLAPETDSAGARVLAERLSQAVRGIAGHRGAPLEIAVGIAVCPPDGNQAVALAARADIALYAARAAGRPVAP